MDQMVNEIGDRLDKLERQCVNHGGVQISPSKENLMLGRMLGELT
jgi:hypothetical protein